MSQPGKVIAQDPPDRPGSLDQGKAASNPLPANAMPITVDDAQFMQPDDGFGRLWHKRFRVRLDGIQTTPGSVIHTWRERFGTFWPEGHRFYRPLTGLQPGEVALIDLGMPAGTRLSTGVVVVDVTETSFTFATTPGHTFAAKITFSAYEDDGTTVAQAEMWLRASDPLYEIGLPLGGNRRDDQFWLATLRNLAGHFEVSATPEMEKTCLDRRRKWRHATNIVDNAFLRTGWHLLTLPFHRLADWLATRLGNS
jgi:hypothetical protein